MEVQQRVHENVLKAWIQCSQITSKFQLCGLPCSGSPLLADPPQPRGSWILGDSFRIIDDGGDPNTSCSQGLLWLEEGGCIAGLVKHSHECILKLLLVAAYGQIVKAAIFQSPRAPEMR